MNEQSAHSSDLLQAQKLLNMLLPKQGSSAKESQAEAEIPKYSSLSSVGFAPKPQPAAESEETAPASPTGETEPVMDDFDTWEACIAACMSATRAEAAFVVDSQGFVIASRGRVPSQGFEGAGAELICSIEQIERVAPDAGKILSLDVEFDKRRIVGFVASSEEIPPYVVGLVSPEPLRVEMKSKITQQIMKNLPHLD
jgi:hypothetical protein